jgi:AmmeMemoRadiSam system protein B
LAAVRAPAVSGRFYPGTPRELEGAVRGLIAQVADAVPGPARGALAPHAGYLYSGFTAACVFARLTIPPLVVILAPNHTGVCRAPAGGSVWEAGAFRTPLGDVTVDDQFARALLAVSPLLAPDHEAHRDEHAIEVLLPFLRVLRSDVRIVPVVLAWDSWKKCQALGLALAQLVRQWSEPVLLLASSDLNHYESAAVSQAKDEAALSALAALDGEELLARCARDSISMCGRAPAAAIAAATRALGAARGTIVDYRHSGWVTGDETAVVGYGGMVIA